MTVNAKGILDRAGRVLLDETNVRWPLPELRLWLNDAIREIAVVKPTAYSQSIIMSLSVGTLQRLPDGYFSVMRVSRNLKTTAESPRLGSDAIRTVDLQVLEVSSPHWHDSTKVKFKKTVKNVAYDARDPRAFFVYPGNDGTGIVEAIVAKIPAYVPAPGSDADQIASYDFDIDVQDHYASALLDYVLFRAYSKDSSFAGSAQRAAAYYASFANTLGVSVSNDLALNPNTKRPVEQENAA
jgi:hypothetical protein